MADDKLTNEIIMGKLKLFVIVNYYSTMPVIRYHLSKNRAGFYSD